MQDQHLQHTLARSVDCIGPGLHSGRKAAMTIRPAWPSHGIIFARRDVSSERRHVRAIWHAVTDTALCTTISNDHGVSVSTVEHLLAALAVCGVDNALIELDGPEVPIMDGSAEPFVDLISSVGTVSQSAHRQAIWMQRSIEVRLGDRHATLVPALRRCLSVTIDFADRTVGKQALTLDLGDGTAARDIAGARTFGFKADLDALRSRGLARGGSLNNAVLVDERGVVNEGGLRFDNEFVRHKALDSLGDLTLAGAPIVGHFYAYKPGHELHLALLDALFENRDAWSYAPTSRFPGIWSGTPAEEGVVRSQTA